MIQVNNKSEHLTRTDSMRIEQSGITPGMWFVKRNKHGMDEILYVCYSKAKAVFEMSRLKALKRIKKEAV